MNDSNLLQTLGQVSSSEASEVFRDHLRGLVRQMIKGIKGVRSQIGNLGEFLWPSSWSQS